MTADSAVGSLFAAIEGTRECGTAFIAHAQASGATSFLVTRPRPEVNLPQCVVSDTRKALHTLCGSA
ncbi:MAG: hypothetical protein R3C11_02970 [Planctomycetaceae bacterium]